MRRSTAGIRPADAVIARLAARDLMNLTARRCAESGTRLRRG